MVRFWLAALFVLVFALPARALELPELAERTTPAVVLLTVEDSMGRELSSGTGFCASPDGRIVTNQHVIAEGSSVKATLSDGSKRAVLGVLASDAVKDIAILQIDGAAIPPLALGDSSRVKMGDEVVVIGSPRGLSASLSAGVVSAIRKDGISDDAQRHDLRSWGIQITAGISPGSSGSPIMTRSGEVIAVAVGGAGESLNFGVPIEVAKSLLEGLGPNPQIMPFGSASGSGMTRNLAISAGVFGALALGYVLWSYLERCGSREGRPRRSAR